MTEKQLQALVTEAAAWLGLHVYHTWDSRRSAPGFPDLVIAGRRVLFRELKSDSGRMSRAQQRWIWALQAGGADAAVWRPADWPARIMAELRAAAYVKSKGFPQ